MRYTHIDQKLTHLHYLTPVQHQVEKVVHPSPNIAVWPDGSFVMLTVAQPRPVRR